ncbi:MAG: DUF4381 domain-containing protein [Pseudomonadota bacterium]
MNAVGQDPLAALRPPHPPAAIDWWPPAPGWWLLAGLALLGVVLLWWRHRRTRLRRAALAELRQLERTATDDTQLAIALNRLLRRVALARFPRTRVAALAGDDWLRFLDSRVSGFASGPGRVLGVAPYAPECALERAALVGLARQWIRTACGGRP